MIRYLKSGQSAAMKAESTLQVRNTVETAPQRMLGSCSPDIFLSTVSRSRVPCVEQQPSPSPVTAGAFDVHGPITMSLAVQHSNRCARRLRGSRHGQRRRNPPTRDGYEQHRQLPRHDCTACTSTEATAPASRRTGTNHATAHRQSRPQPRRGKRFRVGVGEHSRRVFPQAERHDRAPTTSPVTARASARASASQRA